MGVLTTVENVGLTGLEVIPGIGPLIEHQVAGPVAGLDNLVSGAQGSTPQPTDPNLRTNIQTVSTGPANLKFLPWAMGYTVFALVILGSQDSDTFAGLGLGFAWLVTGWAVLTRYQLIGPGIRNLFGVSA